MEFENIAHILEYDFTSQSLHVHPGDRVRAEIGLESLGQDIRFADSTIAIVVDEHDPRRIGIGFDIESSGFAAGLIVMVIEVVFFFLLGILGFWVKAPVSQPLLSHNRFDRDNRIAILIGMV
jgi:hypothetical protein